ncbi:MAG: cytochrome c maturation protein CcmE [Ectothiorhodospiraceae bacterium AqS1]|nr:cytochrome c maturation protein CcmE [Ectothiorhodospiraceae bacterium AqS1]
MNRRGQRMLFVGLILGGVAVATGLVIAAMGENILYFYSPSQVQAGEAPQGTKIRVGGLVVKGSVQRGQGLEIAFSLSDGAQEVEVEYTGILPDLFREGQGVVAYGMLDGRRLSAEEVLAKHDENYMPPEVAEAMEMAKKGGKMPTPDADTDAVQAYPRKGAAEEGLRGAGG